LINGCLRFLRSRCSIVRESEEEDSELIGELEGLPL
jgi:hypothetical protein